MNYDESVFGYVKFVSQIKAAGSIRLLRDIGEDNRPGNMEFLFQEVGNGIANGKDEVSIREESALQESPEEPACRFAVGGFDVVVKLSGVKNEFSVGS